MLHLLHILAEGHLGFVGLAVNLIPNADAVVIQLDLLDGGLIEFPLLGFGELLHLFHFKQAGEGVIAVYRLALAHSRGEIAESGVEVGLAPLVHLGSFLRIILILAILVGLLVEVDFPDFPTFGVKEGQDSFLALLLKTDFNEVQVFTDFH